MATVDLFFLLLLFVVQPMQGHIGWQRLLRDIEAGYRPRRSALYAQTAAVEWLALAVVSGFWLLLGRPFAWLGVHADVGPGFYAVLVVGLFAVLALAHGLVRARRMSARQRGELRVSLGTLEHFVPHTDRELKGFLGLSLTAGIVEELLYRGFVLWALSQWMPLWLAVLVSSVGFGLAHSYQGPGGMLRTGAIGLVFALLFVASGSVWLPIVFHVLFDVVQGLQVRELYRAAPTGTRAATT